MVKSLRRLFDSKTKKCIRCILKVSQNAYNKNVYGNIIEILQCLNVFEDQFLFNGFQQLSRGISKIVMLCTRKLMTEVIFVIACNVDECERTFRTEWS